MPSSKTDADLLKVKAKRAQWVMKIARYLWLAVQAGVMAWAEWELVQEETSV